VLYCDRCPELNYFTIDQLVILQRELVKVGSQAEISDLIYPLLSAVKRDCNHGDLVTAMARAQKDIEDRDREIEELAADESEDMEEEEAGAGSGGDAANQELTFIQEMVNGGFSATLARAALGHVAPEKVDEGQSLTGKINPLSQMKINSTFTLQKE
jgi:hypothetical protein